MDTGVNVMANLLVVYKAAVVSSVVIFGDPDNGTPATEASASETLVMCHADDNTCQHGDLNLLAHLTCSEDATQAATFTAAQAGLVINSC